MGLSVVSPEFQFDSGSLLPLQLNYDIPRIGRWSQMEEALKEVGVDLINLQRLAHRLRSLSPTEVETLELLLDDEARGIIETSLKELDQGKGLPLDRW